MPTAHHTAHVVGAPLTAAELNAPLSELDAAISSEATSRASAVTAEATARAAAVAAETAARQAADATGSAALGVALAAEVLARATTDTNEFTGRVAADAAEVVARNAAIGNEGAVRSSADSNLQSQINALSVTGSGTSTSVSPSTASSGQKVVLVASTTGYNVGDSVYAQNASGESEGIVIASISPGVSVTAVNNLIHSYPAGSIVSRSPAELVIARGQAATLGERLKAMRDGVTITDYPGVVSGTDCTAGMLTAASDAQTLGVPLAIPRGTWRVSGVGNEIFLLLKAIRIQGDVAGGSIIEVASTVGASTDVIRYAPGGSADAFFFQMHDVQIKNQSGNPARHLVNIDVTTSTSLSFAAQVIIEANWIGAPGWTPAGHAIHVENPTLKNPAFFTSSISNNQVYGGMYLVGISDSCQVLHNTITEAGAVVVEQTSGAANFVFKHNNVTCLGGAWFKASVGAAIDANYFEAKTGASPVAGNGAYVEISGSAITPEFGGNNQVSVLTGVALDGLLVGASTDAIVGDMSGYVAEAGKFLVKFGASAQRPILGNVRLTGGAGALLSNASPSMKLGRAVTRYASLADSTPIANTVTRTGIDKSLVIPANTLKVGDVVTVHASGTVSTDAAGTALITIQGRIGGASGNVFGAFGLTLAANQTDWEWTFDGGFIVRSLGAGGTVRSLGGICAIGQGAGAFAMQSTGSTTIAMDTTADKEVCIAVTWGVARAGNTMKAGSVVIEILPSGS